MMVGWICVAGGGTTSSGGGGASLGGLSTFPVLLLFRGVSSFGGFELGKRTSIIADSMGTPLRRSTTANKKERFTSFSINSAIVGGISGDFDSFLLF
jgi:hypothetical protein